MTRGLKKIMEIAAVFAVAFVLFVAFYAAVTNESEAYAVESKMQVNSEINENSTANAINIEVAIVWSDNVDAHLGQSSSVTLYQNGAPISTVTLSSPLWWYQWTGLDSASSYDIIQNSYFEGYYTEYAWDAQNRMTIKNIQNGSPVPPWPTPTPEPSWDPGTNVIIEYYEDGTPVNPQTNNNQNAEAQSSNNNYNAKINTNQNDSINEADFSLGNFFDELTKNINKAWLVYLGLIGLAILFICEKNNAR